MKKIISILVVEAILISCNYQKVESQAESAHLVHKNYSNKQLNLLQEFKMTCTVFNRYRLYIHSLNESRKTKDFQILVHKNWTAEQEMLKSNLENLIQLSPFLIKYNNLESIAEQARNNIEIEHHIIDKYEHLDSSIDWKEIMTNTVPPKYR